MGGANRQAALEAKAEKERREEEKAAFKAAQELESLRRAFKRIDKKGDGAIDVDELLAELQFLGHAMKASEAALTIWEVDDDADGCIDWNEFRTMFFRVRDDQTGYEPRKLFTVVEFLMHDKNLNGSIDLDECMSILYQRYGRVRCTIQRRASSARSCDSAARRVHARWPATAARPRPAHIRVHESLQTESFAPGIVQHSRYFSRVLLDCSHCHAMSRAQELVDSAFSEMEERSPTEKSVNFTTFITASEKSAKKMKSTGLKPGATMVPQVKGATMISQDPSLSHLL